MGEITLVGAGHLLLGAALTLDILLNKARPVSAVLWLAVVWAFPYVGALAYLSFGVERVGRGAADREATSRLVESRIRDHPGFDWLAVGEEHHRPGDHPAAHIFRGTDPAVRWHGVLRGNRARLLVDGDQFYPALFEAIEKAESSVHVQTYIFARDALGAEVRDRLADAASRGVAVRLLYDRFGSTFAHFSGFFRPLARAGAEVFSISQANPLKGRFQINLRNHRKLAVVDGRIGFVGGMNFDERNRTRDGRTADRDYHMRLDGPAVADLQLKFLEDWCFASGRSPDRLLTEECFPTLPPCGEALVQVVPGAPETEGRALAEAFFGAIVAAERSTTIVTPYFVPDEPILQALRYAAIRGVEVRLVLPKRGNHWYAEYAARSLYDTLLDAGVRIFERGPPFLHAKAMIVDGVYAMLGSANLDYRSLHLNFELNVEVADTEFVGRVSRQVEAEVAASREVNLEEFRRRPLSRKLVENFCRLFQPVL